MAQKIEAMQILMKQTPNILSELFLKFTDRWRSFFREVTTPFITKHVHFLLLAADKKSFSRLRLGIDHYITKPVMYSM